MGKWTFENPNPIVGYTVGIELSESLSSPTVRHISSLHSRFRRELPRRLNLQAVTFQMGAPAPQSPQPAMSGVVFDSLLPDGRTKSALTANQNVVTYTIAEYSRWVEFWPMAERLLREVGIPALDEVPARALVLNANNRFAWSDGDNNIDVSALLRRDQKYIAPLILDCRGPCHCFMGYTISDGQEPKGKRTNNVFLTIGSPPDGGQSFLDLNFNLRLELSNLAARAELFEPANGQSPLLERTFDRLHQLNKELMRDILLEPVAASIPGLSK